MNKLLLIFIIIPILSYGQILELYTGGVNAKNSELKFSALVGGNLYLDLYQTQRQNKQPRIYANRMLLGFEHSEMTSRNINKILLASELPIPVENCDCIEESIDLINNRSYTYKHRVRAVSLNAGIEIYRGWYILTGISSYQHLLTLDKELYSDTRALYIDAGLQKVISYNRWFFIPKIKFNHEMTTFAVGVSYK